MNIWTARAAIAGWLRYERRCVMVCWEREILGLDSRRPDMIGVTRDRHVVEVEIKRTMADFRANGKKKYHRWANRDEYSPRQFYFFVLPEMVEAATAELPSGAGLLTTLPRKVYGVPRIMAVVSAPVNKRSPRLDLRTMARMVEHQTAAVQKMAAALSKIEGKTNDRPTD